ncbi:MYH6_7 [Mytilus coruscus]|uniref:MYH6_7 n=1 Tax=Mytilus coruscus TaxID=42192 RepID=A0A6J8AEL3_MYTCO|nr:MYH6_7 [Mytilus coruscus]
MIQKGSSEYNTKRQQIFRTSIEKQDVLSSKITTLTDDRKGVLEELGVTNKCIADLTSKIADLVSISDFRKEFDEDLKRQLSEGRKEQSALADELKQTVKEKQTVELELCRFQANTQKMTSDLEQANRTLDRAEGLLIKSKNNINNMKDGKMDLHLEIQRQEDVIRELSVDVQLLKEKISGLQGEIEDGENRIESMKEEREHIRYKSKVYDDKRKICFLHITDLKKERDQHKGKEPSGKLSITATPQEPTMLNNGTFPKANNVTDWNKRELEHQKTKVLQLELQLYRRDKLIEKLVDKVKQYDKSFSLGQDISMVAYLDENWSAVIIPAIDTDPSTSPSNTTTTSEETATVTSQFCSYTSSMSEMFESS